MEPDNEFSFKNLSNFFSVFFLKYFTFQFMAISLLKSITCTYPKQNYPRGVGQNILKIHVTNKILTEI